MALSPVALSALSRASVSVERGKERVLERRVLGGLLEVAVHLAVGREGALHPC